MRWWQWRSRYPFIGGSSSQSPSSLLSPVLMLTFTATLLSCPFPVLPFKSGGVEPIARMNAPMRIKAWSSNTTGSGPTGSTGFSSRAEILRKLNSARRQAIPLPYDSSGMTLTGPSAPSAPPLPPPPPQLQNDAFYSLEEGQSVSMESYEHPPSYNQYHTIPSPFSSISNTVSFDDKMRIHQRLHHYQKIQRQGLTPNKPATTTPRSEPPRMHSSRDHERTYYTTGTGSDAAANSVDIERYSQLSDLHKKQTVETAKSVETSPKSKSSSATTTPTTYKRMRAGTANPKNNTVPISLSNGAESPTLLPPNYLSLSTFRHIDGTLEKTSGNILSRIADYWRNATKNETIDKKKAVKSSNSKKKETNGHTIPSGTGSTGSEYFEETDNTNASLLNGSGSNKSNNSDGNDDMKNDDHHHDHANMKGSEEEKSESGRGGDVDVDIDMDGGSSLQLNKYISMMDEDEEASEGNNEFTPIKEQYLSLDDGENENDDNAHGDVDKDKIIGGDGNDKIDDSSKIPRDQSQPINSVEDSLTGFDFDFDLSGSGDDSHSFHDDLFHLTTTARAITTISSVSEKEGDDDIVGGDGGGSGSGSPSRREHARKIHSESSEESSKPLISENLAAAITGKGKSAKSGSDNKNVKEAESENIWSFNSHFGRDDLSESEEDEELDFHYRMTIGGILKRELWTIPLFVLAALNMLLIILFEVYVLCRARGQSRRHLFLGQMLLFGLFLCSFLALMFAVHPSILGCYVGRLGVGITYSLIFSVLMVKCVFLLSLDSGIYLPTFYQGMLLFFAVLVQVAVDTQWSIMYPPFLQTIETGPSILFQCGTSFIQLLYSLSYVGFLIVVVGFMAGRATYKGVTENYKESVYILITAIVTIPVGLSWTVAGWMLQGRHQDACVSFGLVAHSLTTFLVMFMPKGRQLASLDKSGVSFEEQDDQGSGYSPSFFHFKPTTKSYKTALWGVKDGNLYTTLEPTVSTINPNVFFHRSEWKHSGMIY